MEYKPPEDWCMICVPRTASTSISVMLNLRAPNRHEWEGDTYEVDADGHYFGHTPAYQLVENFGQERWRKMFTFGFARNPWDRLVSVCARINPEEMRNPTAFADWLYNDCLNHQGNPHRVAKGTWIHQPCSDFLFPCTYVGRFENMAEELKRICRVLGRPVPEWRHDEQRTRAPYQTFYTDAAREWVRRKYWRDIDLFGYRFGD
jgi:hypothetical protein